MVMTGRPLWYVPEICRDKISTLGLSLGLLTRYRKIKMPRFQETGGYVLQIQSCQLWELLFHLFEDLEQSGQSRGQGI